MSKCIKKNSDMNNSNIRIVYIAEMFYSKNPNGPCRPVCCWGGIGGWGGYCNYLDVTNDIQKLAIEQSKDSIFDKCEILKITSSHPYILNIYEDACKYGTEEEILNFPIAQSFEKLLEIIKNSNIEVISEFDITHNIK